MGFGGIPRAAALPPPAPESGPDKAAESAVARRSLFTSAAAAAAAAVRPQPQPTAHRGDEAKKATTQVGRQVREPRAEAKAGALKFWA
jgi:hypothetical protein